MEIYDELTNEKIDYEEAMDIVNSGKGAISSINMQVGVEKKSSPWGERDIPIMGQRNFLHKFSVEEIEFQESCKKESLIPTNNDLSDSAVDLGQGVSDNDDALAELGDYASQLEDRIKSQDDTIVELVNRIKALEGKDNG